MLKVGDKAKIRFVTVRDINYLRIDDVTAFIRELGDSEESDVRNRLNEAARNLEKLG